MTLATHLARSGASLAHAQRLMRHSDPRLTSNVYTRLEFQDGHAAVTQLERHLTLAETLTHRGHSGGSISTYAHKDPPKHRPDTRMRAGRKTPQDQGKRVVRPTGLEPVKLLRSFAMYCNTRQPYSPGQPGPAGPSQPARGCVLTHRYDRKRGIRPTGLEPVKLLRSFAMSGNCSSWR